MNVSQTTRLPFRHRGLELASCLLSPVDKLVRMVVVTTAFIISCAVDARTVAACGVEDLPRRESGKNQLAIKTAQDWMLFGPQTQSPGNPAVVHIDGQKLLCLAWEAPPYPKGDRQIVFIRSSYREDQRRSLFRNHWAAPVIKWPFRERLDDASETDLFNDFHSSRPTELRRGKWSVLEDWHNTSIWRPNVDSFTLVSYALEAPGAAPRGSERLIRLASGRTLTSWVRFTTSAPARGDKLHVAVAYSGDIQYPDQTETPVYRYVFEVKVVEEQS